MASDKRAWVRQGEAFWQASHLWYRQGDAINAVLAAAGYNFRS